MKNYEKPTATLNSCSCEGVYMASGEKAVCRFGREETNSGSDTCQACGIAQREGKLDDYLTKEALMAAYPNNYSTDYAGCPDNMPTK